MFGPVPLLAQATRLESALATLAYGCVGGQETVREGGVMFGEAVGH